MLQLRFQSKLGGWCSLLLGLFLLIGLLQPASAQAAPLRQTNPGTSPQLYLLPQDAANNVVVLETHTVELRLVDDAAGPQLAVNAAYRLRNPSDDGLTVPLLLFPGGDQSLSPFQGVSLTLGGEALPLTPSDGGGFTSQISLPADDRQALNLRYRVGLGSGDLLTMRYAPEILNGWAGNISLLVELFVPNALPMESWIETTPTGWNYSTNAQPGEVGLRWLYDFTIPAEPFRLRLVAPATWARIRAAEDAAIANAPIAEYARLGDLYRDLGRAANDDAVRERFFAQAIAAYTGGLESAALGLASPQEKASLYVGLADIYRSRLVEAEAAAQPQYAELMVAATDQALTLLPAEESRRQELAQWQIDGLQLLLNGARERRDWPLALAIVDQLGRLPPDLLDPAVVAEDRAAILVQQALQLMEQGNRDAALAVAGDQIAADELIPPPQAATLFTAWQITVTAAPAAMQMVALGLTTPDRQEAARASLEEVVQLWEENVEEQDYSFVLEEIPAEISGIPAMRLQISFPAAANGFLLARLLPPRTDYALLRSLLTQLAPSVERQSQMFWQEVILRQPLNLAPAVNEWNTVAMGLEGQASEFEAQSSAVDSPDTAQAESALRARIQAVNYRSAAAEWRRLARQSWLHFTFQVDDPLFTQVKGNTPARSWIVTAASPSQNFVFQTQVLNVSRVLIVSITTLIALMAATAALWVLL